MARTIYDTVIDEPVGGQRKTDLLDTIVFPEQKQDTDILGSLAIGKEALITGNPQAAGRFGVGQSKHDWGIYDEQLSELNNIRAAHQGPGEQFLAFANQAVVGEILGGTIEGMGYLGDLESYGNLIRGTEKEFGNWFSDVGKKLRTWSEETTPIYADDRQAAFAPNHWSWWMQNGKSVASTLSLMIPAAGVVRGATMAGKALGMFSKISPLAKWAATGMAQAAVSRHMENMMEASGVYKEAYETALSKKMSIPDAEEYAARAASKTYGRDWAMYLQDLPQYLLLNSAFGKGTTGIAEKSIMGAIKMGHDVAPIITRKAAAIGADMVGEGFEEGYQYIAAEEAKYLTEKLRDPSTTSSFDSRLNKYVKDGEFWTNVAMGAVGAGVMQTAGKAINDAIQGGDPQTRFVKEFGTRVSHASQQIRYFDLIGDDAAKANSIMNLETVLSEGAIRTRSMDYAKEMVQRSSNPTAEDVERFGLDEASIETLKENGPEILKHLNEYEKLYETNAKLYEGNKAIKVTGEQFLQQTVGERVKNYNTTLADLKTNINKFYELSMEAQDIFGLSSEVLSKQNLINFQKDRLEREGTTLSKPEVKGINQSIEATQKEINRLKGDINNLDKMRDEETVKEDNSKIKDIGGPYNLLEITDEKEIKSNPIRQYQSVSKALSFAELTVAASRERLDKIIKDKKTTTKPVPTNPEKVDKIPIEDDHVIYIKDGKEYTGIVDYVDQDGDYHIMSTTNWEGTESATKPTGESVTIHPDKVVLNTKQYVEEDIVEESISHDDFEGQSGAEEEIANTFLDISYMFDGGGLIPTVTNEALHKFLVDPKSSFEGVTAEMFIDTESEYAKSQWDKVFEKLLDDKAKKFQLSRIKRGKLTSDEITTLKSLISYDNIPIGIQVIKDNKIMFSGGIFYHITDFKQDPSRVPYHVKAQGSEMVTNYLGRQKQDIRKARWKMVPALLKGDEVYSDTLGRGLGHYNNGKTRGNVLERHGLAVADGKLAVSRRNGKIYISNNTIIAGVTANTAGNLFAPTRKTINGKEAWAKVNPTKLTAEHADILWEAVQTRYSAGNGEVSLFPDKTKVTGLTVGEVINILALFGERKTNIDHKEFKGEPRESLRDKAFYVNHIEGGIVELTYGRTKINLFESDQVKAANNRKSFVEWATKNKNYSTPIALRKMGVTLNGPFTREFKIGSWENKAKDGKFLTTAQFLMSVPVDGKDYYAVESDLEEYEGTGSAFVRPSFTLGTNDLAIKIRPRTDTKPKTPTRTDKSTERKEATNKAKTTKPKQIKSVFDIKGLEIGSELYYNDQIVEDGKITDKTKPKVIAHVMFDGGTTGKGRTLDLKSDAGLSNIKAIRESAIIGDWIALDEPDAPAKLDALISILKRQYPSGVFINVSDAIEDVAPVVEVKPEAPPVVTNETVEDVLKDLFGGATMSTELDGNPTNLIDIPKELEWFYKKFGKQEVKATNKAIKLASTGAEAYAVFNADCIYIFTGAPEGAIYHEAFHRVTLGYLDADEREAVFNSARKKYNMPDASDSEISEKLAEEFRAYRLAGVKPKSRTVLQFFKDLFEYVRTFLTGTTRLTSYDIDKLFESINRGQFRYSKITAENRERLREIETPMAVEINKTPISFIRTYHDLDKIVKSLTSTLIITNELDNLNDIKHIKMSKMWDKVEEDIVRITNSINVTQKQLDDKLIPVDKIEDITNKLSIAINLLNIYKAVVSDEFRDLFASKISDMLVKFNVHRIQDEDAELEIVTDNNYKQYYDRASYEINSKDNILASVKFLIATLPKTDKLDPHIGIPEVVDFNDMWNSLMHNLYNINDTAEMMDRLREFSDHYPYKVLIDKLEQDKEGIKKEQLRAAVQKHRHNFVNFLITLGKAGTPPKIEITNADVASAVNTSIKEWNFAYYMSGLIDPSHETVTFDEAKITSILEAYNKLSAKVEKEYKNNEIVSDIPGVIAVATSLLNSIGIFVDEETVTDLINKRAAANPSDQVVQVIGSDLRYIFNSIRQTKTPTKVFGDSQQIRDLAASYVEVHPEKISDVVLGPSNNQYWVYSQNSHVTDTVRRIRTDEEYLKEHLNKIYNDNSYYGKQMLANPDIRKGLEVMTFAMFGKRGTPGEDYLGINPIEDYIFKISAMAKGYIPFPTMADRRTYYMLKGIKPYDFQYVRTETGYRLPEEAVDILFGYAKSENRRIEEARKVILEYEEAKKTGDAKLIKNKERFLVEGYHYKIIGDKKLTDEDNASALQYHNFPSFNKRGETFDFASQARDEIRASINNNIKEELTYLKNLGIIGSTFDVSSNKERYYNRLIPSAANNSAVDILQQGKDAFGSEDMAVRNLVASHFINTIIANNEVEKLFSGDPAFYKTDKVTKRVHEDRIKRLSVLTSTGDNFADNVPEQELNDAEFNVSTISTQKINSIYYQGLEKWHRDHKIKELKDIRDKAQAVNDTSVLILTDEEIETDAKVIVAELLKAYTEVDPTDGQAWIKPEMYRSLSRRLGEWSKEQNAAFELLQLDRVLTPEEEQIALQVTFQPLKLVYFSLVHDGNLAIPTFHKASFATIFRSMTKGKYGDMQIVDMLDRMEGKGKYKEIPGKERLVPVDIFVMDSATKVGNRYKSEVLDSKLEEFQDLSNIEVYKQPFKGLRRQLMTDAHDVDKTKTGTQFLKIVLGNLMINDEAYNLSGGLKTGEYVRDEAFKSLNELSNRGRKALETKLGYKDGLIDKRKLVELLAEDAKQANASDNLVDAIDVLGDEFYIELDALTERKWIQSRIISLISKHTIDVKLPGNQLIQFSNFGMKSLKKDFTLDSKLTSPRDKHVSWLREGTDDLRWMEMKDGKLIPMGCIVSINLFKHVIPNYDKIGFEEKKAFLRDNPDVLAYRIPTQGQSSVFSLTVLGVYQETIGDTITLPSEFTALTGSDFDIDKLYVVRYNYFVDHRDKSFEKIKFLEGDTNDDSPKGFLEKVYRERYGNILRRWTRLNDSTVPRVDNKFTPEDKKILEEIKDASDDERVIDLVTKLIDYDSRVSQWWNEINAILEHYNLDQFKKDNKGKDLYAINSTKAVQNRLIDIFFSIMKSEAHYGLTSAPLEGLTKRLKDKAQEIRDAEESRVKPDMYYQSPRFNENVKFTYNGGKDGIGPFALNNVHHVLAQLAGLEMIGSFGDVMHKGTGGVNIDLSQQKDKDNIYISNWLSAMIDAHVDVAKDPYIMDLNVNAYTYNVTALLLRGGTGMTTFDFLAQPILKELALESMLSDKNSTLKKKLEIPTGRVDDDNQPIFKSVKADAYIAYKWESQLTKDEVKELQQKPLYEAFGAHLSKDLLTTDITAKEFVKRQLQVLYAFTELKKKGEMLNTLVQASQVDTKKFGSNTTELRVFMNKIRKVYEDQAFLNLEKILPYNIETGEVYDVPNANFLGTYTVNSIKLSLDILENLSIYGTYTFDEVFKHILEISGTEFSIDKKLVNLISDEMFTGIVSRYFTNQDGPIRINSDRLDLMIKKVSERLYTIKKDPEYADLKDNMFINYLHFTPVDDPILSESALKMAMFIAVPMKSVKDKIDKDSMINAFKELQKDERPKVKDLIRQLYYYSFFTSGFRSRIYSFFNYIPNETARDFEVKNPAFPGQYMTLALDDTYNTFIKKTLNEMKNLMGIITYKYLIDEVMINNHDQDNLVKYVEEASILTHIQSYKDRKSNYISGVVIKDDAAKYLYLGDNGDGNPIYRPWMKMHDSTLGHVMFKYIGYLTTTDSTGFATNYPVYTSQNMRSYNSKGIVVKEYNMDKSIVPAYNEINTVPVSEEEDFLKYLSQDGKVFEKGVIFKAIPRDEQLIISKEPKEVLDAEDVNSVEPIKTKQDELQETEGQRGKEKVSGFQGYKGGFEDVGKGTPEGDGKDKAMRKDAKGFIGEFVRKNSSTYRSAEIISKREIADDPFILDDNVVITETAGAKIVMLARNSEFKNKPLMRVTKEEILVSHRDDGAEFIVGDMPGVDSGFIDYLQEIGAKFTIYYSGSSSRINLEINPPIQGTLTFSEEEEFPFTTSDQDVFSTEPSSVIDIVNEIGVVDWTKVTKAEWARLREEYKHCK